MFSKDYRSPLIKKKTSSKCNSQAVDSPVNKYLMGKSWKKKQIILPRVFDEGFWITDSKERNDSLASS